MIVRTVVATGLLVGWAGGGPFVVAQQEIDRRATVDADVDIEIYSHSGSVRVSGWDRNEVEVTGTLGQGVERLEFESDRDDVEIRVAVLRRGRRGAEQDVGPSQLEVMVPRGASVEVESLAASIAVVDLRGRLSVDTVAGDISYSGDGRFIDANSTAGQIEISTSSDRAEVEVDSASGTVLVEIAGGVVSATTLTGDLRIVGGLLREGDFESVSGSIYFEGQIAGAGEFDFESFNGDIELSIPADTGANFDISTYSGSIETDFGYEARRVGRYTPEQGLEFQLGDGSANVSIETFAGTVRIRRR